MQSKIVAQPMTKEQYLLEKVTEDARIEALQMREAQRKAQRIDDLPMTDEEYAEYVAEYNEWCDEQNADRDLDADLDKMYQKALAEGTTQPDWTIDDMNGQTLIVVDETIIGRIWTRRDDDIFNTHYTHSDDPKDRWGHRKYWTDDVECIRDLVDRYQKRQAKRTLITLHDGSMCYGNPEDVEWLSWLSERHQY